MRFIPCPIASGIMVELDVRDLPKLANTKKLEPYLRFSVRTFAKIYPGQNSAAWSNTFRPINDFFGKQNKETLTAIGMTLLMMHVDLVELNKQRQCTNHTITEAMRAMGQRLVELDNAHDVCGKIKEFVKDNVPVGDFSNAGNRAQDKPEYTFHQEEVEDLTVISLLCKLLSPLFGTAMQMFMIRQDVDNDLKESHTFQLLRPLLQSRFPTVIDKLGKYLNHIMGKAYNGNNTTTMNGVSIQALNIIIMPNVFTRALVNVDLFYKQGRGNLIKFLCSMARSSVYTSGINASQKGVFQIRNPLMFITGEQGNVSQAEIDAAISKTPLDTIPLASTYVDAIIDQQLGHWNLDTVVYHAMVKYYQDNQMSFTILNRAILCGYFGSALGGGNSVKLLHAPQLVRLVPIIQLLAFGNGLPTLGHIMSAKMSNIPRTGNDDARTFLAANFRSNFAYNNCRENYTVSGYQYWEKGIKPIIDELVSHTYFLNTAPVIWKNTKSDNLNGSELPLTKELGQEFGTFVDNFIMP